MWRRTREEMHAVSAARAALAVIHLEQATLGKLLAHFVSCEPSPVTAEILCRGIRQTLAAEDQANAKLEELEKAIG